MTDGSVANILRSEKFKVSVELVPSLLRVNEISQLLKTFRPSFIGVTQGAGGSARNQSLPVLKELSTYGIRRLAHLVCGFAPKIEVLAQAKAFYELGIRSILVLKGDASAEQTESSELSHQYQFAFECVRDLRELYPDLSIGVAAYPDEPNRMKRIDHLKIKLDAGADFAITQMVFSSASYRKFTAEAQTAGVHIPILPGVCFLHSKKQAIEFESRFKSHVPPAVLDQLPAVVPDPEVSLRVFNRLLSDLRSAGVSDAHIFLFRDLKLAASALSQI